MPEQITPQNSSKSSKLQIINFSTLEKLKIDMEDDFEEVYQAVFSSIQSTLEQLRQQTDNYETITRLFHSIKSPAAYLGAEQLADLAASYEQQSKRQEIKDFHALIQKLNQSFLAVQQKLLDFKLTD